MDGRVSELIAQVYEQAFASRQIARCDNTPHQTQLSTFNWSKRECGSDQGIDN